MVNEKRVRECFRMAVYDKREESRYRQMGEYYKSDYIGKELVKSVFSGTFAFLLIGFLHLAGSIEAFLDSLNNVDWMRSLINIGLLYACFMAVYLLVTVAVYRCRYRVGRRKLRGFYSHLKHINRIYERESKH